MYVSPAGPLLFAFIAAAAAVGCGDGGPEPARGLPADYERYVEVRDCRNSVDHGLTFIRVLVRDDLVRMYEAGPAPFPEGTVVVKAQYQDSRCQQLTGYTTVRKQAPGYFPAGSDWLWSDLDRDGRVSESGRMQQCAACHQGCAASRDRMCADP
jgi:hypothetical protein